MKVKKENIVNAAALNRLNGLDIQDIQIGSSNQRSRGISRSRPPSHAIWTFIWPRATSALRCPFVFGHKLAGNVKEIGPEVRYFAVGNQVAARASGTVATTIFA